MQYKILHPGSNAAVFVSLDAGESVKAEAGAMVARSGHVEIRGHLWGGFFGALKRSMLGGETFFFQELKSPNQPGEVILAPPVPGDIKVIEVSHGEDFYVQSGRLLAAIDNIVLDTKAQKLSAGLFSGAGFFVLHLKGQGHFVVSAFGAILEIPIPAGMKYTVDNHHVVAWSGDTQYRMVKSAKGWIASFTTGGGLACEFTGPGKIYVQTRNPLLFGKWVRKFVPSGGLNLLAFLG